MAKKSRAPKVINDDFSYISAADGKTYTLSIKERLFAENYIALLGNGTQAVVESGYDVTDPFGNINRNLAGVMAHELLRKPNVALYISYLLAKSGFDDLSVEREHAFLIQQNADIGVKARSIDMYYKLKGKIKDVIPLTIDAETIAAVNQALAPFLTHGTQGHTSK